MSTDSKVGDRVQTDNKGIIRVGVITAIKHEDVERTRYTGSTWGNRGVEERYTVSELKEVTIKWDDGEETVCGPYDFYPEDSEMERSFRLSMIDAHEKIEEQLAIARTALNKAEKISDETGIPFYANVTPLSQSYVPASMAEKFPDLDRIFAGEITGAYGEYGGWQHSEVC
jgi:hypothetical protein